MIFFNQVMTYNFSFCIFLLSLHKLYNLTFFISLLLGKAPCVM